jgi:DNA repair protein SbcC/Rad50
VRLNSLALTNFRLHADTRIDFDSGLTGIIGPNGAGKTTILEAIAWALYGMPAVRGKRQDIRSLSAPGRAGVRVELDFELAGHRYRVVRTLSTAELYLDSAAAPIANSTSGVTDLLRRKLGMSQQEFFRTYFTGQKELGGMSAMGPAERAQFLSRVMGYERLRGAQTLLRERRSLLKGELAGLQSALPDSAQIVEQLKISEGRFRTAEKKTKSALARLTKANNALLDIAPKWKAAQTARDVHHQLTSEQRLKDSEEKALTRDVERLDRDLAEVTSAQKEIAAIKAELEVAADLGAQLHTMERLFQEEGRRRALTQNRRALIDELASLRTRSAAVQVTPEILSAAQETRDRMREELDSLTGRLDQLRTDWVRDQQEALTKRDSYRVQYQEVKQQRDKVADLGPESPCPICTRPLTDHFREVLDDLDAQLADIEVNGKYFRNRVEQLAAAPAPIAELQAQVEKLEKRIEAQTASVTDAQMKLQEQVQLARDIASREGRLTAIESEMASIPEGYHATRHAQLKQQHEELAPLAARSARLGALIEREPTLRKDLEKNRKKLAAVKERASELVLQLKESSFTERGFDAVRTHFDNANTELQNAKLDALAADKELDAARSLRALAENARIELERAQERLRGLTMDRRVHDELDSAYTDIRASLNEHLRPEISDIASGFLEDLTDGRYTGLELDDDYNIIVKEDDIPKPVISGGEEDLAHLVLRLAISQMIAERAGQAFSLLILDEVFGSLDETRRQNVVELLRRLHDRFEQVILITHIESVRDLFDRVISVKYDEEKGTARVLQESRDGTSLSADDLVSVGADQ